MEYHRYKNIDVFSRSRVAEQGKANLRCQAFHRVVSGVGGGTVDYFT